MNNLRGMILMVAAMLGFAIEDAFIKLTAAGETGLGVGQILFMIGTAGAALFALRGLAAGETVFSRQFFHPAVLARNVTEMLGTWGFVTALATISLTTTTTILQAAPLIVTFGAALILREAVGWRRWLAIVVGFCGMLLVVRPGTAAFEMQALWAVLGVIGLSARDLATRRIPKDIPTMRLTAWGFFVVGLLGALLLIFGPDRLSMPDARQWAWLGCALMIGTAAYWAITEAMRVGEVSAVAPFRYSRLVFALIIGAALFNERPDALTLLGAGLIIGSGLYAFHRERVRARLANGV
ncbi:MAG: DMT family transporter [Rhizobiaceae bacterium]|jgi:drug/metabolite transporter (DMT)-like permease|nr:DMT family transporter [Rhizobiaceae bacterium]